MPGALPHNPVSSATELTRRLELVDDAEDGPVLPDTAQAMSDAVTRDLAELLDEDDPEVARAMAVSMRSEILDILREQELEGP